MKSYYRKCKHCGRTIQLRNMPGGQWVAYEGYDTIHDCNSPPERKERPDQPEVQNEKKAGYEDLGFIDVNISTGPTEQLKSKGPAASEPIKKTIQTPPSSSKFAIRDLITKAISENRVLNITYAKRYGVPTKRDIEPMEIGPIYCTGYCRLRRDFRTFRIGGIRMAEITNEIFTPRAVPASKQFPRTGPMNYSSVSASRWKIPSWLWFLIGVLILWVLLKR